MLDLWQPEKGARKFETTAAAGKTTGSSRCRTCGWTVAQGQGLPAGDRSPRVLVVDISRPGRKLGVFRYVVSRLRVARPDGRQSGVHFAFPEMARWTSSTRWPAKVKGIPSEPGKGILHGVLAARRAFVPARTTTRC